MRHLVLALSLLSACNSGFAPQAEDGLVERTAAERLATLERQTAQLTQQLRTAQATISELQHHQAETDARLAEVQATANDNTIHIGAVGEQQNVLSALVAANGATTTANAAAISDLQTGQSDLTTQLNVITHDNAIHVANLGAQNNAIYELQATTGQQGDTLASLAAYARALAGVDPGPSGTTDELLQLDGAPVVAGAATALLPELRKPENADAWGAAVGQALDDPNGAAGVVRTDLNRVTEAVANFVDDFQGETAYLRVQQDQLTTDLDAVRTEVCVIGDLAQAHYIGNGRGAELAYQTSLTSATCD